MSLTEIIFWILARLQPVLWCAYRLGNFLKITCRVFEDEACLLWLADNPEGRADTEAKIADAEHLLDIAIGLRAREILGLKMPTLRPVFGCGVRIHSAPSLEHLAMRFGRLVKRAQHLEHLAQRRAAQLRREKERAPVPLAANHQPEPNDPSCNAIGWLLSLVQPAATPRALAPAIAGLRIRAPP